MFASQCGGEQSLLIHLAYTHIVYVIFCYTLLEYHKITIIFITISGGPPTPARPVRQNVTSTSITISWSVLPCNGGHHLLYFRLRYGRRNYFLYFFGLIYNYINSIDARQMNYTIAGLDVNTNYQISIRAEGVDSTFSRYSRAVTITTLAPGNAFVVDEYLILQPFWITKSWKNKGWECIAIQICFQLLDVE